MIILTIIGLLATVAIGMYMVAAGFAYFVFVGAFSGKTCVPSLAVVLIGLALIFSAFYLAPFRVVLA